MADFKMADDLQKKQMMMSAAMRPSSEALVSRTTATREMGFDPVEEFKNINEELKQIIELRVKESEGNSEAQGAGSLISAMFQADSMMENQKRTEMHQRDMQAIRDQQKQQQSDQNAQGVQQEVQYLSQQAQLPEPVMAQMSIPNFLLVLTQRFARLATVDVNEFKIRMLAMKNSTPSLYGEIYNNMKEMNLIQADLLPDLEAVQQYTPGQVPQNAQGDTYAQEPTDPIEAGASPAYAALPEQKPPMSPNSSV